MIPNIIIYYHFIIISSFATQTHNWFVKTRKKKSTRQPNHGTRVIATTVEVNLISLKTIRLSLNATWASHNGSRENEHMRLTKARHSKWEKKLIREEEMEILSSSQNQFLKKLWKKFLSISSLDLFARSTCFHRERDFHERALKSFYNRRLIIKPE